MDEHNENQQQQQRSRRRTKRGPTALAKDQTCNPKNEIEFDNFGQSIGKKQARFSSWIGVQARTRLSINETDWHQIKDEDKEQLWLRVKAHFNIKDDTHKEYVLKIANRCWKSFKKRLIKKYVSKGLDATKDYEYIKEEEWDKFKRLKSTAEFLELSRRNRDNAILNENPARLGPSGYRGKKETWEKEEAENTEVKSLLDGIQNPRARDWVHGRIATDENGTKFLPDNMKPYVDQLIEYDRKKSEGSWVPPDGMDSLIQVLGPEHPGRTRAVGSLVGLKKGLQGLGKRKRVTSNKDPSAAIPGKIGKISGTDQKIDEPQCAKTSSVNVGSPGMKNTPPQFDPWNMSEALKCYLLLPYGKMPRCAKGLVFPIGSGLIHGIPLEDDHRRVMVDIVYSKYDAIPLPVEDEVAGLRVLEDARHAFIQWPRKAIVLVKDCEEDEHVNPDASAHASPFTPPLAMPNSTNANKASSKIPQKWRDHADTIKNKSNVVKQFFKQVISRSENGDGPIHIVAESGIFENQTYEFNIDLNDMVRLISERWIDVSIIAWFEIWLHSLVKSRPINNQAAFMNPYSIQATSCELDSTGVTNYIFRAITHHHGKKYFVAPYWQSSHWVLFVIDLRRRKGHILDSRLQHSGKASYKVIKHIERAVSKYFDGVESEGHMGWTTVECNQQQDDWECGYYVMHWLFTIVLQGPGILFKNDRSCFQRDELNKVVNTWVRKFVEANHLPRLS